MRDAGLEALAHVPRRVRLKRLTIGMRGILWFAVLLCAIGGPMMKASAIHRLNVLQGSGQVLDALILGSRVSHGRSTTNYLTLEFGPVGDKVQAECRVSPSLYTAYKNQPTVPVTTMPNNVHDFEVGVVDEEVISDAATVWNREILVLEAIVGVALSVLEWSLFCERRALSWGEAVIGNVLETTVLHGKGLTTSVRYSYETSLGEMDGRCTLQGDQSASYPEGEPMIVLVGPGNARKSKPLPFFQLIELES